MENETWSSLEESDAQLLQRSTRDPAAFAQFYDRNVEAVLAFFYRRTADAEVAADLTSETFAQAFLSRKRFRDIGAPARAWLFSVARHQLTRMLRNGGVEDRARRRLGIERAAVDDESLQRIEDLADLQPAIEAIRQAAATLSPAIAEALALKVVAELPYAEVAQRLGCSEGAARVRVSRGLSTIHETLGVT
jgi:RNA polymerase sigma-70 factor (ECF subfamily)